MMAANTLRRFAILGLCASVVCPAAAQDFINEGGPLGPPPTYEFRPPVLIRIGDTSSTLVGQSVVVSGARVFGSRYSLFAGFDHVSQTERLGFFDLRTGGEGFVPGIVLEGTAPEGFAESPRMAVDDVHNRVFIWHGRRVSVLDGATLQLTDLLTADSHRTLPGGLVVDVERLIAFAPEANLLFVVRNETTSSDIFETAVIDAATGAVVSRIPAGGYQMSVNRAGTLLLLSSWVNLFSSAKELQLVNVASGAMVRAPYPPDFDPYPASEILPGPPVLDEARGRIIVPVQHGFYALDLQLSVIASVQVPNLTTNALVSRATGRTFLRWTGTLRSGYPLPGPCVQAVFRADDSLARIEDSRPSVPRTVMAVAALSSASRRSPPHFRQRWSVIASRLPGRTRATCRASRWRPVWRLAERTSASPWGRMRLRTSTAYPPAPTTCACVV